MARYNVLGSKFDGDVENFTEQDKERIQTFNTFKGFTVNETSISNIFQNLLTPYLITTITTYQSI